MKLLPNDRKKLLTIILESYPDIAEIEILIRLELGENLDDIVGGSNNKQKIFKLIEWAETRGTLIDLLNAISKDRPDNVELQETIKNLLEKSSQNSKINPDEDDQKKNKLALVIKNCCVGLVIIVTGFMGYRFFQPELNCNNKQLQEQDNSIKIIIADFEGNQDSNLETSLSEGLKTRIPSDVTICRQLNEAVKESSEANELGKRLFPQNPTVLVLWGRISKFSFLGGVEINYDNNQVHDQKIQEKITRSRLVDISLHQKDPLIFKEILLKIADFQVAYRIALSYYSSNKQDKIKESQQLLQDILDRIISCQINNEQLINLNIQEQEVADAYSLLGDLYNKNEDFNNAINSYKCSYKFEKDEDRRNTLLLQQSENYTTLEEFYQASELYQRVINNESNDSKTKSRALVSRAMMFAKLKKYRQAEKDLGQVIEQNLDRPYGLEIRSSIRLFDYPNRLGAISDLSKLCQIDAKKCKDSIDFYNEVITKDNPQEYQQIVSELREIKKTHPEWQKLINQLLEKNNSK
ncbi:effector-associated domain EAD1-containing protein [Dolichospermum circinale]|uniref:effector-associated domain EAD1-containing protein n=1 Tax=Dolichospermum circinale TaxID=109265 RepID=UPI00232D35F9|nr:effector-associated domain EAD1-containing protein [Dolichospermum circinale]MDB9453330.1 effector-associated domain EAD1-containing protein [Dolichospermum circinale CS-541/06]MDB9463560.1 effector-associated domain EAD1-containing protein [Dolichospermum circinale CS-541/04]MDB9548508.1 effector-associated domain EAD1-containing protein [Dolichospermum circinale CS-1031]